MNHFLKYSFLTFFVSFFGFLLFINQAKADTHIWDGEGANENWSTCANWDVGDTCPVAGDIVTFNATSTKNCTIDASAVASITTFNLSAGYTGTITQARAFTVSGVTTFAGAGTFTGSTDALTFTGAYNQSAGIFNAGNQTVTFNNTFTLATGTFNGAGTLDFNGSFALNSGAVFISTSGTAYFAQPFTIAEGAGANAWQHNNGSVVFDCPYPGGYAWNVDSLNSEADEVFNNFQINNSQGSLAGVAGETLIVVGTLTLTNGVFNTDGAILNAQGAVIVENTYDGGTGTLLVSGSGTNTITITSGFTTFNVFTINNANATVDFTGSTATTFARAFTLQAGIFNQDSAPITFTSTFTQSGGTFNGGSTIDLNNNFTLSGGTFNAPPNNFNVGGNWTHTAGGTFNPSTGTVIEDGNFATWNFNVSETFNNFTVSGVNNSSNLSGDTLIVTGLLKFLNNTGGLSNGVLEARGNVELSTLSTCGTASLLFTGSAVQTFTLAAGAEALFDADITVNKTGGSVNLSGTALTMNTSGQDLIIQQGTFGLNGANLTVSGAGTETIVVNNTGNLQLQGGETVTADSASYPQFDVGSTVTYDGVVGPYTMKDWTMTNATLVIVGGASSVFTLGATETIKNVTITSGILSLGANGLTVSTTFLNNGTLRWRGSGTLSLPAMDTDSGTVEFTGDGDAVADTYTVTTLSATYYNLTINSTDGATDIFELGAALDINNNLTITAGDFDVTVSNRAITIGGNFARVGTFTQRAGTVTFDDATKTSIISGSTTFNNFTCTTQDKNFQFTAATTQTISGTLTLTGAASHLIILRSTSTDSYWNLIAGAGQAVTYVNVKDSDASGGTQVNPGLNSFDAGHNLNWQFQPEVNWTLASQSGAENVGTFTLTASLSYAYASDVTVPYTYATGTATLTSDFTITASPLIITAGNTTGDITITIIDDVIDELSETVIVTMGSPTNGTKGATDVHTATITDNDGAPTISIDDPTVSEGAGTGTITVTLTGGSYLGVSVNYETSSGTAISGTDFTATSGTLTWAADETGTKTFNVTITDDALDENDETLTATLSVPVNATISDSTGILTITDNDATPTVTFSSDTANGSEATTPAAFSVTLSAVSGRTVTVTCSTLANTATSGTDYTPISTTLTFNPGETSKTANVIINNDTLDENNEIFGLHLADFNNITAGTYTALNYTIIDNDDPPVVTVTSTSQSQAESAGTATVTITLNTPSGLTVTAPYTMTGTALGGSSDYSVTASPASIAPGDTTATVTFTITDDALDENSETAILTLDAPTNGTLGADTVHTLTITDNDDPPTVQWTAATQSGAESVGTMTVTAQLNTASGLNVTVPYTMTGTATGAGTDYSITASPVTITAGSTTTTVTITVTDDTLDEISETIITTIGAPTNATQGATTVHTATITDNDDPPVVTVTSTSQSQAESAGTATVTITLNTPSGLTVTAPYTMTGTALGGSSDYSVTASPASIAPGDTTATVTFTITDDSLDENSETAILTLDAPTNGTLGADTVHTLTITDNDAAPSVYWSVETQSVSEGDTTITATATLDAVSGLTVTVPFAVSGTAITTGEFPDYSITSSPLTIAAGSTTTSVSITVIEDVVVETSETVILTIDAVPTNASRGTPYIHTATIDNDDARSKTSSGTGGATVTPQPEPTLEPETETVPAEEETDTTPTTDETIPEEEPMTEEEAEEEILVSGAALEGIFGGRWVTEVEKNGISEIFPDFPETVAVGSLVKLPDDGDLETQFDSAVYYIGADHRRHPFPNESVYKSWFSSFFGIRVLDEITMASIPMGPMVTYRPGSTLVKFPSIPKVYAIDSDGSLRWVTSEELARRLYGYDWAKIVCDISEAFWSSYVFGDDLLATNDQNWDTVIASY